MRPPTPSSLDEPPPRATRTIETLSEREFEAHLKSHELEQGLTRHIATLDTGAIVVLTTFAEKLVAPPSAVWLLRAALVCFVLSIMGAAGMEVLSLLHVDASDLDDPRLFGKLPTAAPWLAFGGFVAGMVSLAVFGIWSIR